MLGKPVLAIEHVTLTTGATRESARSEVADHVVHRIREALATSDGTLWDTGWRVALLPTPEGGHVFDLLWRGTPVVRCWLCVDGGASDEMWRAAKGGGIVLPGTRLMRPRRVPWLAASMRPEVLSLKDGTATVVGEAGDLERCVAWALLD